MDNCIFCKIVAGEAPSYKIYEDEKVLAFLSIHPVTAGHTLLIPKDHYRWVQDMPDDLFSYSFLKAKDLILKLKENLGADYVQINVAGEEVHHAHIWLVPRSHNDSPENFKTLNHNPEEFEAVIEKLNK